MTNPQIGPLVSGEDIKRELTKRRTPNIFKVTTAAKSALLKNKVELEEEDGWFVARKNKKSYRMGKRKPSDELLEDEVWCVLAQMGFKEMSLGRNFRIPAGENTPARQIDVFAKDDETVVLIECSQVEVPKTKSMSNLIEKLRAMNEDIHHQISAHYGRSSKLKVRLVIATRNIEWRDVDIEKCKEARIAIIADDEIDYYKEIVKHLKQASRYQLLAHLFEGVGISGLEKQVAATQGTMGGVKFYNFLIHPHELLKIAYIGHKSSRNIDSLDTYQRLAKSTRLNEIAKYIINDNGKFPTNIVVNIKTNRRDGLLFHAKEKIGDESFGVLHLPNQYASAWVIDGQHRLYGYAYAQMIDSNRVEKSTLPVLAFENLDPADEMNMFIDINSKQVKVQKGLLIELYSDLHWNSPRVAERQTALLSRVAARLNTFAGSPIRDRVVITGKKKTHTRCLTQTSLADGLSVSRLLGYMHKDHFIAGPLSDSNPDNLDKSLRKAVSVLSRCLAKFSQAMPEHWELGDAQGGYLCTNISIRAIFLLIQDICGHIAKIDGHNLNILDSDEVVEEISPYLQPVVDFFKAATPQQISAFRRIGSSLAAVKQQSYGMGVYVNKACPEFRPTGLLEYIDSRDEEGTEKATVKINQIQKTIFNFVIRTLKETYADNWYVNGIPHNIRKKCWEEWDVRNRVEPEESYLSLIHYQSIAQENWELMKNQFSLDNKNKSNKKECVQWIKALNDIRQITHHPEKGVLSSDQVAFVEEIEKKVQKFFI